jgi:hypothetical protein
MKRIASLIALVVFVCGISYAQEKTDLKGEVVKHKSSKEIPVFVNQELSNDSKNMKPANTPLSAGSKCSVEFENYTYWDLSCYVIDEKDVEKMAKSDQVSYSSYDVMRARTTGSISIKSGSSCMIILAEFTDGTYAQWGPFCVDCAGEAYSLEITEDNYHYYGE